MSEDKYSFNFIDLFSGAGGFSLGFSKEHFHKILAIEKDHTAAKTYQKNFPKSKVITKDIRDIHSIFIEDQTKEKIDVILASPPCEPFTGANPKRKKSAWERFHTDSQGDLIFHTIRIIGDLRPDFFVVENVIPIISGEGKEIIIDAFKQTGIKDIYFNFINAQNYGCPSVRKRLFISNFYMNLPKKQKTTVNDALKNLPDPAYPNNYANHDLLYLPERIAKKIHKIDQGQAGVYFRGAKTEKTNWVRLDPHKVANVVMGKSRFIHPTEDRSLTVREHARLMTFPDEFIFTGSIYDMLNQVGEAVPPAIANLIARQIKYRLIKKKEKKS